VGIERRLEVRDRLTHVIELKEMIARCIVDQVAIAGSLHERSKSRSLQPAQLLVEIEPGGKSALGCGVTAHDGREVLAVNVRGNGVSVQPDTL